MNTPLTVSTPESSQKTTPLIYKIMVVLVMMSLMGGTLTGVMTYINLGYTDTFFTDWLSSFLLAAVTVMPAGFLIMALLTKLIQSLLPDTKEQTRNLVIGISMALIMESAMAFTTTLNNVGVADMLVFIEAWWNGLLAALPVALSLMLVVSMTVKPKIENFLKS
ncbi:DUF2798 domain-containing protein [Agarivorans sp. TSD2052]|uniref:DUF2798 domain-containing protein n=1 Tax=Agarivorans sp. TSD2052 TaxID=2937286 RepID=UPI002010AB91|nr:DUF2798 domain-containing protein [Agarivorans sp. TSD2052]UPW17024.1 DUF2798 domain-containing protein [Agarivorans sp. TSD2052]